MINEYERLRTTMNLAYPIEGKAQKIGFLVASALSITLFVLNCLAWSSISIHGLPFVNLGLSLGSITLTLLTVTKEGKIGKLREVLQFLPILILSIIGIAHGSSLATMAKGIAITQMISAGVFYGLFAHASWLSKKFIDCCVSDASLSEVLPLIPNEQYQSGSTLPETGVV